MKELAKSALSLGCALSLLGAKQALSSAAGRQTATVDVLGPVTRTAVSQLDESMQRIHRAADNMESRAVDMAFSLIDPSHWPNPRNWNFWASTARAQAANYPTPDHSGAPNPQASDSTHFTVDHSSAESSPCGSEHASAD